MKQINYTAQDIERYHSGNLSAADMHSLEKAALDDPFLADALEGYAHTPTATLDVSSLQKKLHARIEQDDKKRVFFISNNWMKIAALFILFAGGGWLVVKTLTAESEKKEVAHTPVVQQKTPTITATENRADSTQIYSDAPVNNMTARRETDKIKGEDKTNDLIVFTPQQKQVTTMPSTLHREALDSTTQVYAYFDKARSERSKSQVNPSFKSDAIAKKENNAGGRVPGVRIDTIKNLDVVLQSIPMADDEIVVVNKNKTVARQDAKRRMQITVDTLEPAEGWTNFGDYIATNMRSPDELVAKPVIGEVELSFEVNKQGEPVNITVVRSLCDKCDEEAIRLLKEGPKWKKNKKRGTVRFNF